MQACDFEIILYDIDGTLVDTGGAGMQALSQAAEEHFGAPAPMLDLAGSTDLGIWKSLLDFYRCKAEEVDAQAFFDCYHGLLEKNLGSEKYLGRVFPGVAESLAHCAGLSLAVGLLTGNTCQGAAIKMRHYGLQQHFPFGAYGDDHADRNLLGPVALSRAALHHGKLFDPAKALVIGDTPKDIACAHAMGARCLAVATGSFSVDSLKASGADRVVATLEEWWS